MLPAERQNMIIKYVNNQKGISVSKLSEKLKVSKNTIRRDLSILEEKGLLRKTHGGAVPLLDLEFKDSSYNSRQTEYHKEKMRIGKLASELIDNNSVIYLDAGTTTLEIARNLGKDKNLTVCTTSIDIASELISKDNITTFVTGGIGNKDTRAFIGPQAEKALENFHVDITFLSTAGISFSKGLTSSNVFEPGIKRAAIFSGKKVIVVAANHRINSIAKISFASLNQIDELITDKNIDKKTLKQFKENDVKVHLA